MMKIKESNKCNMKKSIMVSFFAVVAIISISTMIVNSKAYETRVGNKFEDDTIVTEENIVDVLDYLNIEHGELIREEHNKVIKQYTVGELKEALGLIQLESITIEGSMENDIELAEGNNDDITERKDKIINKTYSQTEKHDGYELEYSVDIRYNKTKKKFIETTGQNVDIDSDIFPIIFKITKKKISSSCTASKATLKANITVTSYVGVGDFGLIEVASHKVKSDVFWYAK